MACPGMYHTTPAPTPPYYTGHMYTVSDGRDGSIARVNPKPYILNPNPFSVMNHTTQAPTRSITSFIRTHSTRDCHSITTHPRIRREVGRRGALILNAIVRRARCQVSRLLKRPTAAGSTLYFYKKKSKFILIKL